jgi:glycosyltransferase involved in cell wall biosynthesis
LKRKVSAIFMDNPFDINSGTSQMYMLLAQKLIRNGNGVILFSISDRNHQFKINGVQIIQIKVFRFKKLSMSLSTILSYFAIRRVIKSFSFDSMIASRIAGLFVVKGLSPKLYYFSHQEELTLFNLNKYRWMPFYISIHKILFGLVLRNSGGVVVASKLMLRYWKVHFPSTEVLLFNPIHETLISSETNPLEAKISASTSVKFAFLWVGRLEPIKDPLTLVSLAAYLETMHLDFRISVVGSGSLEKILRQLVKEQRLEHYFEFYSQLTHEEVFRLMKEMDFLLSFSLSESFGLVMMEALSQNTSVISSKTGFLWTEQSCNGILVLDDFYSLTLEDLEKLKKSNAQGGPRRSLVKISEKYFIDFPKSEFS